MIKIQSAVQDIVMKEFEAYFALTNGYMNMSSYAYRIRPKVEELTKKQTTIASLGIMHQQNCRLPLLPCGRCPLPPPH